MCIFCIRAFLAGFRLPKVLAFVHWPNVSFILSNGRSQSHVKSSIRSTRIAIDESYKVKATIRKFILAVNYAIAVIICLTLLVQTQIPTVERALYGFGAIFLGMGIRRLVKNLISLDEDNLGKT